MYPTLFHFGRLVLPTFGVLAACGLMLALALSLRSGRLVSLDADKLWDAGLFAVVAAFVFSRVLLIAANFRTFLAAPALFLAVPSLTATGLLLTAIATGIWLQWKRIPLWPALDAWSPCATLVWAFLSLGHLAEGSDPGLPARFGVRMRGDDYSEQPVALYAAICALMITALLVYWMTRMGRMAKRPLPPGKITAVALMLAGVVQFLLTFLREPGAPSLLGLDVLQVVALGLLLAGAILLLAAPASSTQQAESPTIDQVPGS